MIDSDEIFERHEGEFSKARELLSELIALQDLQAVFDEEGAINSRRVYTQSATIWLLILQRLGGGLSLNAAVLQLIKHHSDILPRNRRVEEGTLSGNSSAYNNSRQALPMEVVEAFSHSVCDHLASRSETVWDGRRVFIIDGTTVTLPPTPELKKAFPPATNQQGESVWPVAMLMVASELSTGCVLVPQIDAMYGENNSSEAQQARKVIDQLPDNTIVLADSGFGIFSVAHHCQNAVKEFVFRLTASRGRSLLKSARLVEEEEGYRTSYLTWHPSAKERKNNPHLPLDASIKVFVHEIELAGGQTLYLVSNVEADAASVGELYLRRYDIEFDIRDLKVTMDTENIQAKKLDTVKKELMGSIIAYNMVSQLRRQASKLAGVKPRRLSFTGVWLTFQHHLLYQVFKTRQEWTLAYKGALVSAAASKHPNRKKPRSYPRVAHTRRQKSTKFQKSLRKKKSSNEQPPPD